MGPRGIDRSSSGTQEINSETCSKMYCAMDVTSNLVWFINFHCYTCLSVEGRYVDFKQRLDEGWLK